MSADGPPPTVPDGHAAEPVSRTRQALAAADVMAFAVTSDLDVTWVVNGPGDGRAATAIADVVGPEAVEPIAAMARSVIETGVDASGPVLAGPPGDERWVDLRVRAERDGTGGVTGALVAVLGPTESASRARVALELAHLGDWSYSLALDAFTFSDAFYAAIGWSASDFGGYTVPTAEYAVRVVHPSELDIVRAGIAAALQSTGPAFTGHLRHRFFRSDGSEGVLDVRYVARRDADGRVTGLVGANMDITAGGTATALNATLGRRLESAVQAADIGVWETSLPGGALLGNEQFLAHRGFDRGDRGDWGATFQSLLEMTAPEDRERLRDAVESTPVGGSFALEYSITARDGRARAMSARGTVEPSPERPGEQRVVYVAEHDVTEQRAEALETDALTGLGNRRRLISAIAALEPGNQGSDGAALVAVFDIVAFSNLNEVFGYDAGDAVLVAVGDILAGGCPEGAVVCRLAGDKFAVLLDDTTPVVALRTTEELKGLIEHAGFPSVGGFGETRLALTAGLMPVPVLADERTLLKAVDHCLRSAKRSHSPVTLLDEAFEDRSAAVAERLRWGTRVMRAVDEERLELHAQPIVRLADGHVVGFELLARLREDGQLIAAGEFIPAVMTLGMMRLVDGYVVDRAVRLAAEFSGRLGGLRLTVNLSPGTLTERAFAETLEALAHRHGADLSQLCIEMIETEVVGDLSALRRNVAALRALGVKFVIDDFGTGASSPEYLREFEVDLLKLHGRFVVGSRGSAVDRAVVGGAVGLAEALDIPIIAEWVEDAALVASMLDLGVTLGQGYFFGRPAPLAEVLPAA